MYPRKIAHLFVGETSWPTLTADWEEKSKSFWAGEGFSWEKQSEQILQQEYYLGAIQYQRESKRSSRFGTVERFVSSVFFAPMIDHTVDKRFAAKQGKSYTSALHIVPMTFPKFLTERNNGAKLQKYRKLMTNIMKLVSADEAIAKTDMDNVLRHELALARYSQPEYLYDYKNVKKYKEIEIGTLEDLINKYAEQPFSLISYVNNVLNNPDVRVNRSEKVLIPDMDKVVPMYNYINRMSQREQSNLLLWRVFAKFAANFLQTTHKDGAIYENIFETDGKVKSREDNCVNQIKTFFPKILDDLIIDRYLEDDEKKNILRMFDEIKREFSGVIKESDWMDQDTKTEAMNKLTKMNINVGKIENDQTDGLAGKIKSSPAEYINNIRHIGNAFWRELVSSLNKPKDIFKGKTSRLNLQLNYRYKLLFSVTGLKLASI